MNSIINFEEWLINEEVNSKWNLENLKDACKGCVTYKDFLIKNPAAHSAAQRLKLMHMLGLVPDQKTGKSKYNLEKLKDACKGCVSYQDFLEKNPNAFQAAKRLELLDKLGLRKYKYFELTEKEVIEIAKKYRNKREFLIKDRAVARRAKKLGIYDDLKFEHGNTFWNNDKEKIKKVAKKFRTRSEFAEHAASAYVLASKMGILDELGFEQVRRPKWTDKKLIAHVSQFETKAELDKNDNSAYSSLSQRGLMYDLYGPGITIWDEKRIELLASNCTSLKNFQDRCPIAFRKAKEFGLLDVLPAFFKEKKNKPKKDWTYEELVEEAKKFNTKTEFRKKSPYAVDAAEEMGVYNEITQHMKKTPADNVKKYTIFKITFTDGETHYARSSTLSEKSDYKGYCVSQSKSTEYNSTFLKKFKGTNIELIKSEVLFTKLDENESLKRLEELINNDTDSINNINMLKQKITDYDKASPIHIPKGEFFKDKEGVYWVKESYYLLNNKKPTEKDTDDKLKSLKNRVDKTKYLIVNNIKYLRIKSSNLVVEIEKQLKNQPKDLSKKPKVVEKDLSRLMGDLKPGEFSKIAKELGIGENLVIKFSDLFL